MYLFLLKSQNDAVILKCKFTKYVNFRENHINSTRCRRWQCRRSKVAMEIIFVYFYNLNLVRDDKTASVKMFLFIFKSQKDAVILKCKFTKNVNFCENHINVSSLFLDCFFYNDLATFDRTGWGFQIFFKEFCNLMIMLFQITQKQNTSKPSSYDPMQCSTLIESWKCLLQFSNRGQSTECITCCPNTEYH